MIQSLFIIVDRVKLIIIVPTILIFVWLLLLRLLLLRLLSLLYDHFCSYENETDNDDEDDVNDDNDDDGDDDGDYKPDHSNGSKLVLMIVSLVSE